MPATLELLVATGSVVVAATITWLMTSPPVPEYAGSSWTRMRRGTGVPGTTDAIAGQVTICAAAVQPSGEETKLNAAGSVSVSTTPVAVDGPALATTRS